MKKALLLALCAAAGVARAQTPFAASEYLDINSLKAVHLVHGDMLWNPGAQRGFQGGCEYPKGSGHTVANHTSLWLGGYDDQNQLHISVGNYRKGNDFWPGPLENVPNASITYSESQKWAKVWKVNRSTIDSFRTMPTHTAANTPASILTWPGNGNTYAKGYANAALTVNRNLAPFVDFNSNGVYEPLLGEYPQIKGDQMLWWVFNTNGPAHDATGALYAAPMDIYASAYAYNASGMRSTMLFYEFQINNRSQLNLNNFVIGLFSDLDIGGSTDDYAGFDSTHRLGIMYNGDDYDSTGEANEYHRAIPMAGFTIIDLPGESRNLHYPLGSFKYFNGVEDPIVGQPDTAQEYYNTMNAKAKNGSPLRKHDCYSAADSPVIRYMVPGDPSAFGEWSQCICSDSLADRRLVLGSRATTLSPGGSQHLGMALLVQPPSASTYCGANTSFSGIRQMADSAWYYYYQAAASTGVPAEAAAAATLKCYPNPAHDRMIVETPDRDAAGTVTVYDAVGRAMPVQSTRIGGRIELNVAALASGLYRVQYRDHSGQAVSSFLKD